MEIKITRDEDGKWWNKQGNRVYIGDAAKILDFLFMEVKDNEPSR